MKRRPRLKRTNIESNNARVSSLLGVSGVVWIPSLSKRASNGCVAIVATCISGEEWMPRFSRRA